MTDEKTEGLAVASALEEQTRSLLDRLLDESRLYRSTKDYKELLDFVVRLRNFAPFNAMLLQVQKPGLSYAASAKDWRERFGRYPREGARPLLILWPFGPVALVYDVLDTDGKPLPEDVSAFAAKGTVSDATLHGFELPLGNKHVHLRWADAGDRSAGHIQVLSRARNPKEATEYSIQLNRNHDAAVQFVTLAHELGHLVLGHLGPDSKLSVPSRPSLSHVQRELEAESVAYIVGRRNGVHSKSQTYLAQFFADASTTTDLDVYQVLRAAGQVETMLGLASLSQFERPQRRR